MLLFPGRSPASSTRSVDFALWAWPQPSSPTARLFSSAGSDRDDIGGSRLLRALRIHRIAVLAEEYPLGSPLNGMKTWPIYRKTW